jgi:hypothetical protein
MRRGKTQVLYNFLPDKTFDHESGQAILKVTNFEIEEETRLNQRYILAKVAWLLNQWPQDRRRGFPDPHAQPERYVLGSPTAVESEIFPLLFQCDNWQCRRVSTYQNLERAAQLNAAMRCRACGSTLTQLHHVLIHNCGHIRPFVVPRCPAHGYDHMRLDTGGSQKYTNFRWRCLQGDFQSDLVIPRCEDCNLPAPVRPFMRPIVHRATSAYYPQYRTLINLPGRDLDRILDDPERHWLAIAAYLRLFDHGPDNRLVDLVANPQGATADQEELATIERMIRNAPPALRASLQTKLDELRQSIAGLGGNQRGNLIRQARSLVVLPEQIVDEVGQELLEFVRPDETLSITTLRALQQKAPQLFPARVPLYQVAYPNALQETGLADVRLIGDFPVTTVIMGYTRGEREATNTVIRSFPRLKSTDPRTPLFVDTTETEALMFRLDPVRVIRWLDLNGLVDGNLPDLRDEAAVRAWLLNQMTLINPFDEVPEDQPVTRAIYGLVHSFSHLVLRQAVIQSGFDRTSLSEYLFPHALAFVLYSNNRSAFTIGGLYTLFEQTLDEHLRAVVDKGEACVYDPVCIEETGSCHACLHISEMSCEHFNRNLSRKYLFGRIEPDGNEFIGYWDSQRLL